MDLYKSLESAQEKRVFEDYTFYISPSVIPKPAALKTLVEAGGGRTSALLHTGLGFLKETIQRRNKKKAEIEATGQRAHKGQAKGATKKSGVAEGSENDEEDSDEDADEQGTIAVISCEDDREMWGPIVEAKAHVYSHELIIQSILRQSVDLGTIHALA
jgi:hypothetical protein